jgi:hypothetical protein
MAHTTSPHEVHIVSDDSSTALLVVVGLLVALFIGYLFFRNTSYFSAPVAPATSDSTNNAPAANSDAQGGYGGINGSVTP